MRLSDEVSLPNSFLQGDTIILRPLTDADAEGPYPGWFNDAEVCRGNSHHVFPYVKTQALDFIRSLPDRKDLLVLAVIEQNSGKHVGNVSLQNINPVYRSAELAIVIGEKNCWGTGLGTKACALMVNHGFTALNLHRVYSGTFDTNIGFQKIAKSLGMKQEGVRRQAAFKDGVYHDVLEYGLLREEFIIK